MNDVLLLGAICIGLAAYCLHLRLENRRLYLAGQYVTMLLCKQVQGDDSPALERMRDMIKQSQGAK